jgi:hypothetical protein
VTSVRKLEIRIDQTGDASKGIKGIAGSIGKLTGVGLAAGAAAIGGVALLTGAVVGLGTKLVTLGADAEEMEAKFDVVFGMFAGGAKISLEQFGDAVGRSTYELMEMASTVQDTFVPLGFARGEATAMSVELTKLAVDMGSFNNVADADVMRDLQSAIVGNHETMRKYGVIITETTLGAELMRMGIEEGTKTATEQEKVQARLNIIMAGTADAQGDAAATSGSWTNQMRGLKAAISEGATAMGAELLPVLTPLLADFTAWVVEIMPKALEVFKEFTKRLKESLGPALVLINDAIKRIAEAFGLNTEEVSGTDVVLQALEATLGVIITAIELTALAFQGLAWAIEQIKTAIDWVIGAWNDMRRAAEDAIDAIPDWLIPGSPTPFELGLRGIGDAMKGLDFGTMAVTAGGGAAAGGGGVVVNLTYSPTVSLADQAEAENKIVPFIRAGLRELGYA